MEEPKKKKPQRKQAHQNTFAFRHNPNSKLTKKIAAIPITGLCRRCTEKIEWKKQYRKYKIQEHLARCTLCLQKNIALAYNIVCEPCGGARNICRMCRVVLNFESTAPLKEVLKKQAEEKNAVGEGVVWVGESVDDGLDDEVDGGVDCVLDDEVDGLDDEVDGLDDEIDLNDDVQSDDGVEENAYLTSDGESENSQGAIENP